MMNYKLGELAHKSAFASVTSYQGHWPNIADSAFLADGARIVGQVKIADDCGIWFNAVVRGDVNTVEIGRGTNVQDGTVIHCTSDTFATKIGESVTIGHLAMVHGCTIDDCCLIGMQAIVMDGAVIGKECIVGAGAVVTQNTVIPPRSLVLGSPAKVVRSLREDEVAALRSHAEHYVAYTRGFDFRQVAK